MEDYSQAYFPPTFHHHCLAYWKPLATTCLLTALGFVSMLVWMPLGLVFLTMAAAGVAGIYLFWAWHTFTFTEDSRLIRRRGLFGCAEDVITLFGVLTPYQIPILGKMLNVGSVHLGIPGPNIHIRHVADFDAFHERLVCGTQQQQRFSDPPVVQVFFQMPPVPYGARQWMDQLPPD
jgi:hypothetical protein